MTENAKPEWLVFGGFGMLPDVLFPVFGRHNEYINVNALFSHLVVEGKLRDNWVDVMCAFLNKSHPNWRGLRMAGWSTGAIMAYAMALRHAPSRMLLLAPTPSFCRTNDFKHGPRPAVLESMKRSLVENKREALIQFGARSGIAPDHPIDCDRPVTDLVNGLTFLQQASLLPVTKVSFPLTVVHGNEDTIVPVAAGRYLCNHSGGTFIETQGGHAFFMTTPAGPDQWVFNGK